MCNLYAPVFSVAEIRRLFAAIDRTGNAPWPDKAYPNHLAPVLRRENGKMTLSLARWGLPSPAFALKGKSYDRGVTNVRNLSSPHWRRWLGKEHRCLIPFTAFSEPTTDGNQWFTPATGTGFFACLHVSAWSSVRKVSDGETTDDLFGFLTCDPNDLVASIHPKAMPVILTEDADLTAWLEGADAGELQRLCPVGLLRLSEEPRKGLGTMAKLSTGWES